MISHSTANADCREHQRQVEEVEDHDAYQQSSRAAKKFPAADTERELHEEIQCGITCQAKSEARSPGHREQRNVGVVLDHIQNDMREYCERYCCSDVRPPHRFSKAPRQPGKE